MTEEAHEESRHLLALPHDSLDEELQRFVVERGEPPWRAGQILRWVYARRVLDYARMTNLPSPLRAELEEALPIRRLRAAAAEPSADGTVKFLWERPDETRIESVRIPTAKRITLCVSSQAGCPLGCTFCATALMGLQGDLEHGEIVEQVLGMLEERGETASVNVVFMGMGEPMLNLRAVLEAVRVLNDRCKIGARRITISTAGIVPGIKRLAEFPLQVRLSVSLHAATDELRTSLVPINKRYPLHVLMEACRLYVGRSGRRLCFEYVVLPGVNDTPAQADGLRDVLGDIPAKINLIPYNPIPGAPYRVPTEAEVARFAELLRRSLPQAVMVRENRGADVTGACGQLAAGATAPRRAGPG